MRRSPPLTPHTPHPCANPHQMPLWPLSAVCQLPTPHGAEGRPMPRSFAAQGSGRVQLLLGEPRLLVSGQAAVWHLNGCARTALATVVAEQERARQRARARSGERRAAARARRRPRAAGAGGGLQATRLAPARAGRRGRPRGARADPSRRRAGAAGAREGEANALVAAKRARLDQALLELAALLATAQRQGWALVALDCAGQTTTPAAEASVLATFARCERRSISERTRAALGSRAHSICRTPPLTPLTPVEDREPSTGAG
jgi:DNA invertase Pin-like site-specific DNA recombinase